MTHKPSRTATVALALGCFAAITLSAACGQQSAEDKVTHQITENMHALTADERSMAQANAKQFYEKTWPARLTDGTTGMVNGFWSECRPSDSNSNGLVTCFGKVPQLTGGFADVKRFCGYRKELVGCSDQDTAK